jgi:hypothetical protein
MPRPGSVFVAITALMLLSACQSEPAASSASAAAAPAATPTATSNPAPASGDTCDTWVSEVKELCAAYVEGREVAGDCTTQSINVRTSFDQPEMQDPKIGPVVCNTHLTRMQRDRASAAPRPAVGFGEACQAFAAKVRSDCIDTLGTPGDAMACNAQLSMFATIRSADAQQRESACEMAHAMHAN